MFRIKKKKVVVMGGGTGTYTVLSGLKHYSKEIHLSAIISVSDSGGSTGRLRDEFGYLPVGDFRMALAALAEEGREGKNLLRDLFQYRFDKGGSLNGHSFGNLFLIAMTDILGSEEKAIEFASEVLRVRGKILPVSTEHITLVAKYADGSITRGEAHIDEPMESHDGTQRIEEIWIEPTAHISRQAKDAIMQADCIVLGPGDLYTSTLANVVVPGVAEALQRSDAKIVYIINLMTRYGQTHNFTALDYIGELVRYSKRKPDTIFINSAEIPEAVLKRYITDREYPVPDNLGDDASVVRGDFLSPLHFTTPSGDTVRRSFVRHDSHKIAQQLLRLL